MLKKHFLAILICFGIAPFSKAQFDTTIVHELRFDLDSDRLDGKAKSSLDSLLKAYPLVLLTNLKLYGHTDSLADIEYNRALSKRRVQAVLQYLVYKGLNPLKVETDYYGEEQPLYSNAPNERYKNRRVELEMQVDLALLPDSERKLSEQDLSTGQKLRLANLNFVGNQAIPIWQSIDELRELLYIMEHNPDLEISLQGHVCCGNDFELSVARARMVYDFLVANGISKIRLDFEGYGNKVPLFEEVDDESRALNRRVEVEVIYNSENRRELDPKNKIRLETPVMNVKFISGTARITPAGDFMLGLIADMLKGSEGLRYEFVVFDNINNGRLSAQRAAAIERILRKKGVPAKRFKVLKEAGKPGIPKTTDVNWIRLKMIEL